MLKFVFAIFFFCLVGFCSAQVGLIEDPDGYTNIRKEASSKSEILSRINENEVFFYNPEYMDIDSEWIEVWQDQQKFSKQATDFSTDIIVGFIHRSRLKMLDSLELAKAGHPLLTFEIEKADTSRVFKYAPYGLEIPLEQSNEITQLCLLWNQELMYQDDVLYDDLYNVVFETGTIVSNEDRFITYVNGDSYFIYQQCADGAGYYEVVWVVRDGEVVQRLVGSVY